MERTLTRRSVRQSIGTPPRRFADEHFKAPVARPGWGSSIAKFTKEPSPLRSPNLSKIVREDSQRRIEDDGNDADTSMDPLTLFSDDDDDDDVPMSSTAARIAAPTVRPGTAPTDEASAQLLQTETEPEKADQHAVTAVVTAAGLSLLAVPLIYGLDALAIMEDGSMIGLVGCIVLPVVSSLAYTLMKQRVPEPYFDTSIILFALFSFTCVVDLLLALSINGNTTVMSWYVRHGEPYFNSSYGFAANLFDGTAHWVLYMAIIYALTSRDPSQYRSIYLYWLGSVLFSLANLVPGGTISNVSDKLEIGSFLNVPYVFFPMFFLKRVLETPRAVCKLQSPSWLLDVTFAGCFLATLVLLYIRFAAAAGSMWDVAVRWRDVEPLLNDETGFFQVFAWLGPFYQGPCLLAFAACLLVGASEVQRGFLTDLAVLLAGGVAETYFCFLVAAVHPLTKPERRVPEEHSTTFWACNAAIVVLFHLFAHHCTTRRAFQGFA